MNTDIAIKLENINKTYTLYNRGLTIRDQVFSFFKYSRGRKLKALNNINLEIRKVEFFGIVGHNGSGKSTLIHIMNQSIPPDKNGKVTVNGRSMQLALGMGFNQELTARQNITINSSVLGLSIKEINKRMQKILEFADMESFADTPVKFYSTGMKSKLMFSIAVLADADIFLMDEFFRGVGDNSFREKADKVFHDRLIKGKTIVHVSHNIHTIKKYYDRVMILEKGRIKKIGKPEEVLPDKKPENKKSQA